MIGELAGALALLKGLPLAYQRDLQEDKPPLFAAAAMLEASLDVHGRDRRALEIDRERMRPPTDRGLVTATAVADALVRRGVAFRAAHGIVGRLVADAERVRHHPRRSGRSGHSRQPRGRRRPGRAKPGRGGGDRGGAADRGWHRWPRSPGRRDRRNGAERVAAAVAAARARLDAAEG